MKNFKLKLLASFYLLGAFNLSLCASFLDTLLLPITVPANLLAKKYPVFRDIKKTLIKNFEEITDEYGNIVYRNWELSPDGEKIEKVKKVPVKLFKINENQILNCKNELIPLMDESKKDEAIKAIKENDNNNIWLLFKSNPNNNLPNRPYGVRIVEDLSISLNYNDTIIREKLNQLNPSLLIPNMPTKVAIGIIEAIVAFVPLRILFYKQVNKKYEALILEQIKAGKLQEIIDKNQKLQDPLTLLDLHQLTVKLENAASEFEIDDINKSIAKIIVAKQPLIKKLKSLITKKI